MAKTHYSTKETAQCIRVALKQAFPGFTFRVFMPHHGSTNVVWTDGPTEPEVERVVSRFSSKSFDGMDDSTHYHTQTVDGHEVSYSGYIFTRRHVSETLQALAKTQLIARGWDFDGLSDYDKQTFLYRHLRTLRPNGIRVELKAAQ